MDARQSAEERPINGAAPLIRRGEVRREWADGEYVFRMGIREWESIDTQFDVGPYELLRRLSNMTFRVKYPRETIRLALRAGGSVRTADGKIDDSRINRLITEYVDERPLLGSAIFIADVLTEILVGPPGDEAPKSQAAGETRPQVFQTADFPSPPSSDRGRSSDTPRTRSGISPSSNSSASSTDTSTPTA